MSDISTMALVNTTYENCKRLIVSRKQRLANGLMTKAEYDEFAEDLKTKLDIFLLNNRITQEQYDELMALLVVVA